MNENKFVAQLTIYKGKGNERQYIKKFKIKDNDSVITIGRMECNDITLIDDDKKPFVSRIHAVIILLDTSKNKKRASFFISDLGSAHGTMVGKSYINKKALKNGDEIRISDYTLLFKEPPFDEDSDQLRTLNEIYNNMPPRAPDPELKTVITQSTKASVRGMTKDQKEFISYLDQFVSQIDSSNIRIEFIERLLFLIGAEKVILGHYESVIDSNGSDIELELMIGFERDDPPRCDIKFIVNLLKEEAIRQDGALWITLDEKRFIALFRTTPPPFNYNDLKFVKAVCEKIKNSANQSNRLNKSTPWPASMVGLFNLRKKCLQIAHAERGDILILGETGLGKEALAQFIHNNSPRKNGPFISVNCSLLPDNLAYAELFGYMKGAFTGALKDKPGYFEMANGGTLFLDEVGDMPQNIQVALLTAMQRREIMRLSGDKPIPVNVNILAATDQDLKQKMQNDTFRQALYKRFTYVISVPPLRERQQEVPLLAYYFLDKYSHGTKAFSKNVLECLRNYNWPGNIRELEKAIEYALLSEKEVIFSWDLPPEILIFREIKSDALPALEDFKATIEKEYILKVLRKNRGNKDKTIRDLKIARQTLYSKLKEYDSSNDYEGLMPDFVIKLINWIFLNNIG